MAVPYLGKALKGWTRPLVFSVVTKTIVNHVVTESDVTVTLNANIQPMPKQEVERKPESQRSWRWWSIIVKEGSTLLKPDDKVTVDGVEYTIQSVHNWTSSGFQKYEAVENYGN